MIYASILLLLLLTTPAQAVPLASAELDWPSLVTTTTGTLVVDRIVLAIPAETRLLTAIAVGGSQASAVTVRTEEAFWLYGEGEGALTLVAPYQLTGTSEGPAIAAAVALWVGPGNEDAVMVALGVPGTQSGTLTVARHLVNPTWGPLVTVLGEVTARADSVPEPATWALLALSLAALGAGVAMRAP